MNITLDTQTLTEALARVDRVTGRKAAVPILDCVQIKVNKSSMRLITTDLDLEAVWVEPDVTVTATGALCVPFDAIKRIAGKLPKGGQVRLSVTDGERLRIETPRSHFELPILPSADFPSLSALEDGVALDIAVAPLRRLFARVEYAISTEETRYYLNGIYLHDRDGRLAACATDGHRLGLALGPALDDLGLAAGAEFPGVIVPRKTVSILRGWLDGMIDDDPVSLSVSDARIRIEAGGRTLLSKLIDGTFPDYDRVIPKGPFQTATVDSAALSAAAARVSILSTEKSRAVQFDFAKDTVTLRVSTQAGDAREDIASALDGDPVTIGFNGKYLAEALSANGADTVIIDLGDAKSPARLTTPNDPDALDVIMPLRV